MQYPILRSIINNTFLPQYYNIEDYFDQNNLAYNNEYKIDGGFVMNFSGSDDKKKFEKNLKTQPNNWYYRTHPVKYTLNSLGYRAKEFDEIDWKESIVMFGCSLIFGTGVTDEHTIPYFLEKLSGRPVVNLGIQGSSIQTTLHNSIILHDSKYPIPKAVICLWPDFGRIQLYNDNTVDHLGPWSDNEQHNIFKFGKRFFSRENVIPFNFMNIKMTRNLWKNNTAYCEYSFDKNVLLINQLDNNIKCESIFETTSENWNARDLNHFDSNLNMIMAKNMYEKIKSQGVI